MEDDKNYDMYNLVLYIAAFLVLIAFIYFGGFKAFVNFIIDLAWTG